MPNDIELRPLRETLEDVDHLEAIDLLDDATSLLVDYVHESAEQLCF